MSTIAELKLLKESENKVEFKEAKRNYSFAGGSHTSQEEKRRCFLGYVVALANEKGGLLVLGMEDKFPHKVVGSDFGLNKIGELEDETYVRLGIRVKIEQLYEDELRVVVVNIPSRPIGKILKFEGVGLMRVGDSLRNMSDEEMYLILSEQEPDFSAKICGGISIHDLDKDAILNLKQAYARKQDNLAFLTLSNSQALTDLGLLVHDQVTYAALILLGKSELIQKYLPQATTRVEYRNSLSQINFDNRIFFLEPYFLAIEKIWETINQRNGKVPVQQGPYIFDIPFFNKEVIREALNNAIAHRDYRRTSEVVIKQFPNELHAISPGGFPLGVSLDNLLTVNSTPRNRLLSDIMAKTGVVERSGQGIDKIFYQTISEAKPSPDYNRSDNYQVELRLSAIVEDKAFALFIRNIQASRNDEDKLSVLDVITLNKIRKGENKNQFSASIINKLEKQELIERVGKTNSQRLILSKEYYIITGNQALYSKEKPLESFQINMLITSHLEEFKKARMRDFVQLLNKFLTREQVKYHVEQMVVTKMLEKKGKGSGTYYIKGSRMEEGDRLTKRVIELGLEQMKKLGEIDN